MALDAADAGLLPRKVTDALLGEISGSRAHDYVTAISRFERIQASQGWHDSALWVKSRLDKAGFRDARIEGWPSNGETWYYTWQTPIGWRARGARLEMIEPYPRVLADYAFIGNSLVKHSAPAGVTAELVNVGSGVDPNGYQGKDVRGKIVLAYAYSGAVAREAVARRGALGMVTYMNLMDRRDYPDLLQYTAIWPKWSERGKLGFGFNLSKLDAQELAALLDSEKKVVLHAHVDSDFYESRIEVLTTTIPGAEPGREVLLAGHLDHPQPSANDNASGAAGLLEIATALRSLIDRGELPPPRRTIRFLWVSEFYGTIAYLKAHPDFGPRTIAAINCDMIGEDLARIGSLFYATRTPDSLPSFLNDLTAYFVNLTAGLPIADLRGSRAPFNFRLTPYSGGSDHYMFNDGSYRVPSTMFGHSDVFHHTAQDTPDKVDPTELKRVSFLAAAMSWWMATAGDTGAERLLYEMYRGSLARFAENIADAEIAMHAAGTPAELHRAFVRALRVEEWAREREVNSLLSAAAFATRPEARSRISGAAKDFAAYADGRLPGIKALYARLAGALGAAAQPAELTAEERAAARIVPLRAESFRGPLGGEYLSQKLKPGDLRGSDALSGHPAWEAVNYIDGKRSLFDIYKALDAEFGSVTRSRLRDYLRLLKKAGLVF